MRKRPLAKEAQPVGEKAGTQAQDGSPWNLGTGYQVRRGGAEDDPSSEMGTEGGTLVYMAEVE